MHINSSALQPNPNSYSPVSTVPAALLETKFSDMISDCNIQDLADNQYNIKGQVETEMTS